MEGISLIYFVSFLSGLASFLHQSIWMRSLGFVLGNSSVATTVVLAAFVGGLGLGGLVLGTRCRNARRRYVSLQAAAALLGISLPWFALHGEFWPGGPADFLLAFVLVFAAAFLIGGSFPLLFALLPGEVSRREAGWMYGLNAAGAMLGAAIGPYLGSVVLGLQGAGLLASAGNAINALGIFALVRAGGKRPPGSVVSAVAAPAALHSGSRESFALWALLITGFVTMGFELLAARALMFYFKGFAVVYAAVISVFLLGLSLGSFLAARKGDVRRQKRNLGMMLVLAGIGCVFPPLISGPVGEASWLWGTGESGSFFLRLIGVTALFALPATIALGAAIPLAFDALEGEAGGRAGRAAFWNCFGSLVAPLLVGMFLVQACSLALSFFLVAIPALAMGARLLWRSEERSARWLATGAAIPVLVMAAPGSLENFLQKSWIVRSSAHIDILEHRDGRDFGVSVVEDRLMGERTLLTDSFRAAGTHEDFRYMHGLGSLPLLAHPKPDSVCVICFGTGTTAGAVARHPEVKEIQIVEIAPEVMDFAPYFFDRNRDLFPGGKIDDRVAVAIDDGRRFLHETAQRFDVITLEPLLPVTPVAVHFYTKEFYELAKSRLHPGGILCQWIPTAAVYSQAYRALLATFFEAFPEGGLWALGEVTVLLGGGPAPQDMARGAWRQRSDLPAILRRMGFANAEELLASRLSGAEAAKRALGEDRILSDNLPWVEWFGHQNNRDRFLMACENLQYLLSLREQPAPAWVSSSARERKFRFLEARFSAANENLLLNEGVPVPMRVTLDKLDSLVRDGGPSEALRWKRRASGVAGFREGIAALQAGNRAQALESFSWATREDPGNSRAWTGRGVVEWVLGKEKEARASLSKAFALFPRLREGIDWKNFTAFAEGLESSQVLRESQELGRMADASVLSLRPDWSTLATMARSESSEQAIALWAAGLRLPFEFERILGEKILEELSTDDAQILSFLLDLFGDVDLSFAAASAWKQSGDSKKRERACLILRDLSGKRGLEELIALLADSDVEVRRAAIAALFHRTRQSLDYDFQAEPRLRELAIRRWLAWLEKQD